jgi:hypothetical protein
MDGLVSLAIVYSPSMRAKQSPPIRWRPEGSQRMNIPAFHDDQRGTVIIVAAGIFNQ